MAKTTAKTIALTVPSGAHFTMKWAFPKDVLVTTSITNADGNGTTDKVESDPANSSKKGQVTLSVTKQVGLAAPVPVAFTGTQPVATVSMLKGQYVPMRNFKSVIDTTGMEPAQYVYLASFANGNTMTVNVNLVAALQKAPSRYDPNNPTGMTARRMRVLALLSQKLPGSVNQVGAAAKPGEGGPTYKALTCCSADFVSANKALSDYNVKRLALKSKPRESLTDDEKKDRGRTAEEPGHQLHGVQPGGDARGDHQRELGLRCRRATGGARTRLGKSPPAVGEARWQDLAFSGDTYSLQFEGGGAIAHVGIVVDVSPDGSTWITADGGQGSYQSNPPDQKAVLNCRKRLYKKGEGPEVIRLSTVAEGAQKQVIGWANIDYPTLTPKVVEQFKDLPADVVTAAKALAVEIQNCITAGPTIARSLPADIQATPWS